MVSDIVILGGGLNGAALALALADGPWRIVLVDPEPPTAPGTELDRRIYAFSPANVAWLRQIGGWDAQIRAQVVWRMRIAGDAGGRLDFDALEAGLPELAWIAGNDELRAALWRALVGRGNVRCIQDSAAAVHWDVNPSGTPTHEVRLAGGETLAARLLVAADGADSWLRNAAGIEVEVEDYRHVGIVANFACTRPHRGTAWQWFRDGSVLAYLPLPGKFVSIVWSSPSDEAPQRLALNPDEFAHAVTEVGAGVLGPLSPLGPATGFPLKRRLAREWVRPGLVLLGDAAHTVHPLAGQGVNLGFRDSRLLAAMLACGGAPGEIGRLTSYAARRREDVVSMQFTTGGLKKLFAARNAGVAGLRNTGLSMLDGLDPLKQALIRHAVA